MLWLFTLVPEPGPVRYTFSQMPQQLLSGDAATVISAEADEPANGSGRRKRHKG